MQIIFGEKCVSLLRLFFAAVLMLWCAQTAAYSGQCHTTQGNPYIGVNFGVKTLEEEANTAGVVVVKDKFYQWNESNDYYVSCDCDKDNVRRALLNKSNFC
ncbi:putative fimbrial-like protein ElfG [Escherichia coli]|nr:putative fimbrial-like protein ElfG [Escherichia coli]